MDLKSVLQAEDPNNPYLHICLSGQIPPNAPQLLSGSRYMAFLDEARRAYDIILLDSAPTRPVTDTLVMDDFADIVLYVVRADFTEKKLLEHIQSLYKSGKMQHIALVLNDVKRGHSRGYNYGYGYGYSYEKPPERWYEKLFKFHKQ